MNAPLASPDGIVHLSGMLPPSPANKPSSPCTKVCILDAPTGLCEGCGRSREEIGLWGSLSEGQRLAIMAGLPERLRRAFPHRAGGAAR